MCPFVGIFKGVNAIIRIIVGLYMRKKISLLINSNVSHVKNIFQRKQNSYDTRNYTTNKKFQFEKNMKLVNVFIEIECVGLFMRLRIKTKIKTIQRMNL